MARNTDIDSLIDAILRDDLEPPDEDYSPADFAATLARSLASDQVRELARAAIKRLPASLAASILEGVATVGTKALDPQLLLDAIPSGRQVDSAGMVVQVIVSELAVAPDEVAAELFSITFSCDVVGCLWVAQPTTAGA